MRVKYMKEKMCRHCGTKENLRTNKNGVIYNCCRHCYETIEVPDQIRKANESIIAKYGVSDLGQLRQKRSKDTPPKQKEKKIITCKYCGTTENLVVAVTKKRTITFHTCKEHWEQYQKDKYEIRKKSNKEKFGVEQPLQNSEIKSKFKQTINSKSFEEKNSINKKREQTNLDRFGVTNPNKLKEFSDKRKSTLLEKYGVSHPMESSEFREKQKKTLLRNFGVDNPLKSKEIRDRVKKTNLEKYGSVCPLNNETVKLKSKKTLKDNYDVTIPMKSTVVKKRVQETNIEKYGSVSPFGNKVVQRKSQVTSRERYWNLFVQLLTQKKLVPLFEKEDYINTFDKEFTYKCLRCDSEVKTTEITVQRISCGCLKGRSSYEDDIAEWLTTQGISTIDKNKPFYENNKKKFEIDVFLPDLYIGIEYNGLYWHSNLYIDKIYHQDKCIYFKNKGIRLIQIFENEWADKQDIVKSLIRNNLKLNKVIYARECSTKILSDVEAKMFLEINHLAGHAPAKLHVGLIHKNAIVAIGSFGKPRYKTSEEWELIRFCSLCGVTVVGGFDKILSFFEKSVVPKSIVSYIDLRYFDGHGYINNGFSQERITTPNYFYFHPNKTTGLFSRIAFQRHKLAGKLKVFDPTLSEAENMYLNGYLKIYDAGNLKMVKTY